MEKTIESTITSIKQHYESIDRHQVDELIALYAPNAFFKDPFNAVYGRQEIKRIFLKMFDQLNQPKFIVLEALHKDQQISLLWEFQFQFKRWDLSPKSVKGVSWLELDEDYLIASHIDYWDPAQGIYEHLPVVGGLMRGLRKLA